MQTNGTPEQISKLVTKLVGVVTEIDHVEKRGRNEFHKYNYVKASDLANLVRDKLSAKNIFFLSDVVTIDRFTIQGEKGDSLAVNLQVEYSFLDGDSGASISFKVPGCGADKGDKGIYKAITGSLKYALRNSFLVPDEADPENEGASTEPTVQDKIITAFRGVGVNVSQLEKYLKHPLDKISDDEREILQQVFLEIRGGKAASEFFDVPKAPEPVQVPAVNHEPVAGTNEERPKPRAARKAKPEPAAETAPASASPDTDIPATEQEKVDIRPKLNHFQELVGNDRLKDWVLKKSGKTAFKEISAARWKEMLEKLETAEKVGLTELDALLKETECTP